jgi:methylenetetrahydrofolate reductase (NADPH)
MPQSPREENSVPPQDDYPAPARTLAGTIESGDFALTAEVAPPLSADIDLLLAKAAPFRGLADAVNLTDGASARAHMCALASSAILLRNGVDPIMQITCRDRNRIAIQSDVLGAVALGVRNFLIMTGDQPSAGDQPDTKPVFDLDSGKLIGTIKAMRDEGVLPSGRAIERGLPPIMIGAADMPLDPAPGWEPKGLRAKADAGAGFAQTQFCMDAGVVERYVKRLAEFGLIERVRLIIGVVPLRSAKSAAWIRQNLFGSIIPDAHVARMEAASDPAAEGRRICVEVIEALRRIPGVAGAHVMAPGNEAAAVEVLRAARELERSSA